MTEVQYIVVCQTADLKPFAASDLQATAEHLEALRQDHRARKFADIGWHYAIDRAGRVWQLRPADMQPQALRDHNEHALVVALLGSTQQELTPPQQRALVEFIHALRGQYHLPVTRIYTKRELVSTTNPGDGVQAFVDQMRREQKL
jgi:hypothetical protein